MLKSERQESLVALCEERGAISVRDLSRELGISEMTVRRDLDELDGQGRIERVHGGARSKGVRQTLVRHERSHVEKHELNAAEKDHAATLAASVIEEGDAIYLGTGTTCEAMVAHLPAVPLKIVTSSLAVFTLLVAHPEYDSGLWDLCLIGGSYLKTTMAFVGPLAEDALGTLGLARAFVGTNGILGTQIFGHTMAAGRILRAALDAADNRYVVTDASKFGRRDFSAFYELRNIDNVFTDRGIAPDQRQAVEQYCRVVC